MIQGQWDSDIASFIAEANANNVRMLMVGGGAVDFHGYQRHSVDVDFWIDITEINLHNLIKTFRNLGYDINDFPNEVKAQRQNISPRPTTMQRMEKVRPIPIYIGKC